jgi:hypothetical protein
MTHKRDAKQRAEITITERVDARATGSAFFNAFPLVAAIRRRTARN